MAQVWWSHMTVVCDGTGVMESRVGHMTRLWWHRCDGVTWLVCDGTGVMESHDCSLWWHRCDEVTWQNTITVRNVSIHQWSDLDSVHQSLRSGRATFLHGFDFSINNVRSFSLHRNHGLLEHKKVSGSFWVYIQVQPLDTEIVSMLSADLKISVNTGR